MAKFSYTQNGILFNNLDNAPKPIKSVGGKLFNTNNDYEYATEDGIQYSLDAITLDWNGAYMGNNVNPATLTDGEKIIINTKGQLLSYVSTIAQKLTTLENILINI